MRILPSVSQPTLDSFRKDVYRPRLALLLLILLLGVREPKVTEEQSKAAISQSSSANALNEIRRQGTLHTDSSTQSFFQMNGLKLPFARQSKKAKIRSEKGGVSRNKRAKRQSSLTESAVAEKASIGKAPPSANTSPPTLRIPRSAIQLLLRVDTLAAIIPLHILWIVRLGGMMIEDGISKSTVASKHSPLSSRISTHSTVLAKVAFLAMIALSTLFLTSTSGVYYTLSLFSFGTSNNEQHLIDSRSSILPLRLIVVLELSATLLSLLSPLIELNNPRLSRHFPNRILLPSPSHAPNIIDVLPLPPGLAEILSGRASNMQSRAGRHGIPGRGGGIMRPARHGLFVTPNLPNGEEPFRQQQRLVVDQGLQDLLTMPSQPMPGSTRGKAPRVHGVKVQVDSSWLLENVIILWGSFVGAIEYLLVALSLPTLSPTSFPPILALLSLRSQIYALVNTWTSARRSVECLEFVRRRWAASPRITPATAPPKWLPDQEAEILCPICLELIRSQNQDLFLDSNDAESCRLDCGHELHAICLVQIFLGTKQAFCPCCHDPLKATPPTTSSSSAATTSRPTVAANLAPI